MRGYGLSTFRFSDVPGLKRLGKLDEEGEEEEEMGENGTPKKKRRETQRSRRIRRRKRLERSTIGYETVESMEELCIVLIWWSISAS